MQVKDTGAELVDGIVLPLLQRSRRANQIFDLGSPGKINVLEEECFKKLRQMLDLDAVRKVYTLAEFNGIPEPKVLSTRHMLNNLKALQDDVGEFFLPHRKTNLNLFEIACLGKPELALQGELIHYLRTRNWLCVQEAGYREFLPGAIKASSVNLDILVFDRSTHDFIPLCCIELKHFSGNQGPPNVLITGLSADYKRLRPDKVPIMLVGIYTTIIATTNQPVSSGLHRFARAVCGPVKPSTFQLTFASWLGPCTTTPASPWMHKPTIVSASPKSLKSCILQTGEQLSGTVEAFIGVPV